MIIKWVQSCFFILLFIVVFLVYQGFAESLLSIAQAPRHQSVSKSEQKTDPFAGLSPGEQKKLCEKWKLQGVKFECPSGNYIINKYCMCEATVSKSLLELLPATQER